MNLNDLLHLTPLLIMAAAPLIIMLGVTIGRNFRFTYLFSLFMYIAALLSLFYIMPYPDKDFSQLLVVDNYGVLFLGIICFAGILITVLSYEYLSIQAGEREEFFIIMFVASLGASVIVLSEHFIAFFLGLETLSISLYVLIAYLRWRDQCIEAGVKFLVIASLSTAFLLFGMGLIYAGSGTMIISDLITMSGGIESPLMLTGLILMFAGIGFKLALFPFHMWTPDIYQGAPAPVTTFIATVSKGAVLAFALRLFFEIRGHESGALLIILSLISVLSMFAGNFLALRQRSVKRLLAYSSIAQLGYLVITLLTGTADGIAAAIFYLAAYTVTTLGAFGVISILSVPEKDADDIEDMKGLFWSNPLLSVILTLALLSLAGLPLTAGFISKFYLVLAGVKSGLWLLAFALIINSAISLYYYLRVIRIMFAEPAPADRLKLSGRIIILSVIIIAGILLLGILPSFLTDIISGSALV